MNPKYHLLVAAAALSLGACSTDDTVTEPVPENGGYKISFTIAEDSETRTTLDKDNEGKDFLRWLSADRVGIFTTNGGGNGMNINAFATADINNGPVKFVGSLENPVSSGDKFYAYYPYNEEQSDNPARAKLTIPAKQKQRAAGEYNGQSQPLVAVPMDFQWEHSYNNTYNINGVKFRLLGAIVELQLFSSNEALSGEKIRSVKFVSESALAGDFTFDLTTVTVEDEPQIAKEKLTEKVVTTILEEPAAIPAEDGKALVYLTIAPGTYTGRIVVETNVALYTFSLATPMNFKRAVIKGLPADLAGAERGEINPDTAITFADEEVERICLENWDTSVEGEEGKGELSYREAAAVTEIGTLFQNVSISSFDELQYFTGLKSIGVEAFYDCRNLTSIKIPDEVTTIGKYAFYSCINLTRINIPDKVTTIGESAFQFCNYLPSIKIPEGVTTIGQLAFGHCTSLKSITIPETVTSLTGAFTGCVSLSAFYGKYSTDNNRCLIQDGTLLAFAQAGLTTYTIPEEVTKIGEYAFAYCYDLTSIHIPDGVTAIGNVAFNSCIRLTEIGIPKDVTEIGFSAFANCYTLTSIHIPEGVTKIESSTFYRCSNLTEINIPTKVTTIRENAFRDCSSLKSVYCKPTTPPFLVDNAFNDNPSLVKIYVPTASVEKYKTAKGWISYADIIEADNNQSGPNENDPIQFEDQNVETICITNWDTNRNGELSYQEAAAVTDLGKQFKNNRSILSFNELQYFTGLKSIGVEAFSGCSSLTSIKIPDGVTTIGGSAFWICNSLTSIIIPDGVTTIGRAAFYCCSKLKSINIPQTVSFIDEQVFAGCTSLSAFYGKYAADNNRCLIKDNTLLAFAPAGLTQYTIPDEVTVIGASAFERCSSLTSITIPEEVTELEQESFDSCTNLANINIPDRVTKIGIRAFAACKSLTSITIPEEVIEIGGYAFNSCNNLTSVYCKPTTPPTIGDGALTYTSSAMKIYVPTGSGEAYKAAADKGWIDDYTSKIVEYDSSTVE